MQYAPSHTPERLSEGWQPSLFGSDSHSNANPNTAANPEMTANALRVNANPIMATIADRPGPTASLNEKECSVLDYLTQHPTATQTELAEKLYISRSTVADYTASLQTKGLLIREGSRRAGRWIVTTTC